MKKVLSGLTVLFAAALLIYSCNPADDDLLPPSNTSQLTAAQARQMLQGTWYCYKRESVDGPTCAGGANETQSVYTFDLQYTGYKLEFTNISNGIDPQYELETYDMYYGGGNGTEGYNLLTNDDENFSYMSSLFNLQDGELYLWFELIFLEGYGYEGGGKIVSLTDDELVLYTLAAFPTLVYFRRSNQTNAPYNALGLSGDFVLDSYKEVNSGVVDVNEAIPNGTTYSFNNEIYHEQSTKRVKYRGTQSGGSWSGYYLDLAPANPSGFTYEVSSTHLFSSITSSNSVWSSYKIIQLNANELVLRDGYLCNTYKEYHLTKVN
jgi:hypothetical protein